MPAMSEMKHDMERLKRQGFNLIKLQEHWMIDEPEKGRRDFSRYEELIAHTATVEMGDGSTFTVCYQKTAAGEKCSLLASRWRLPK